MMGNLKPETFLQNGRTLMDSLKKINHFIKPAIARLYILRFRELNKTLAKQKILNLVSFPNCETFRADAVKLLLDQAGCKALRIHLGVNEKNEICMILSGVDENAKDIVHINNGHQLPVLTFSGAPLAIENDVVLLEDGQRCPKNCPPPSEITT